MNAHGHRTFGVLAHLAATPLLVHQPPMWTLGGCMVAVAAAAGPTSPDCDQRPVMRVVCGGHRRRSHWPETAVVLSVAAWMMLPPVLAAPLIAGWWSHLAMDMAFGGIPFLILGGRRRVGFGLKTGGLVETGKVTAPRWVIFGREVKRTIIPFAPAPTIAIIAAAYLVLAMFGVLPTIGILAARIGAL